ncbi:MAG: winged helix-turn-helix domain-containing protein [Nocardioidaceae bacterium]
MSAVAPAAAPVAAVARLLGDDSRAAMCLALLDGRAWTVTELADQAGVGKAAASEHVAKLAGGGLVTTETQGRCKYVRLTPAAAQVLEPLSALAGGAAPTSLNAVRTRDRLAAARTCYDHLAGRLGVTVYDGLVARRVLTTRGGLAVSAEGRSWFADLGIDLADLERRRRTVVRDCLDLTERRPHLAGSLGAALCETFLDNDWVRRPDRSRALALTPTGERVVAELFGPSGPASVSQGM